MAAAGSRSRVEAEAGWWWRRQVEVAVEVAEAEEVAVGAVAAAAEVVVAAVAAVEAAVAVAAVEAEAAAEEEQEARAAALFLLPPPWARPGRCLRPRNPHDHRRHRAPIAGAVDRKRSKHVAAPCEPPRDTGPTRLEAAGVETAPIPEPRRRRRVVRGGERIYRLRNRREARPRDPRRGRGRAVGVHSRCSGSAGQENDSAEGCVLGGGSLQRAAP